ncbi:hypothetical protein [Deinococcus alpinitundrae]|uniref:hypothetical protein n=1 Tax=Deinococcus alpinitundrae TaxID=468913 RepID=UPI00137B8D58|nr:hypothetical protein [Deinococcus alpinitundrae]
MPDQTGNELAALVLEAGRHPEKQKFLETNVDNGRHYYLFDLPELGQKVELSWTGINAWWFKIYDRAVEIEQLAPSRTFIKSNGVADTYRVSGGALAGLYVIVNTWRELFISTPEGALTDLA